MKHFNRTVMTLIVLCCMTMLSVQAGNMGRKEILFDSDWKFIRNDIAGAEATDFDDASWHSLDLPHDYSIENLPGTKMPFDSKAISGVHGGFTTGGTAWYRKTFDVSTDWKGKVVELLFEGVYMNADVWINGKHIGKNYYGYIPFHFDITNYLTSGKNVIAVQVKNEGRNSRWYTGSGIYRHVWLKMLEPVHIIEDGVYITTPTVTSQNALVSVETFITNKSVKPKPARIITEIVNSDGVIVATKENDRMLVAGDTVVVSQQFAVRYPALWSPDSPVLYKVNTKVESGSAIDCKNNSFGIRTITMDMENGFKINGVSLNLKGGCVHHDNGPLGSKAFDRAEERKVELLKANGFNAVRCAHNPPSVAFLDACDRLGLLVIDEAFDMWNNGKNPQDYHLYFEEDWQKAVSAMIRRDRNHPSIFLWSIGNEIYGMEKKEVIGISEKLSDFIHLLDPTRPITAGINGLEGKLEGFFSTLGVSGINYGIINGRDFYPELAEKNPGMVMYGSESYAIDQFDAWKAVEEYSYVIGDFVWTAIDYIGEASIGWQGYPQRKEFYPWNLAFCGDMDLCGWKRPQSYYRDAFWKNDNIKIAIHSPISSFEVPQSSREQWSRWHYDDIVFDWNWKGFENKLIKVDIYTSCDEVELFLNDRSLGKKIAGKENKNKTTYEVPYEKGELKAVGYQEGKKVEDRLITSDKASLIKLFADRYDLQANGQDLCYVTVELHDTKGILDPKAENQLYFSLEGNASIVAVGNANPKSLESYTLPQRRAWRGKCLVVIRSDEKGGLITLNVRGKGLQDASILIFNNE